MDEHAPPPLSAPPLPPAAPPPPPPPPPLLVAMSASQPPRRGRGWMVFALILLVLLGLSMLFNLGSFAGNLLHHGGYGHAAGPRLDEVVQEDNDSVNKIAVVPVEGIITSGGLERSGANMVELIRAQLRHALEDERVKAVILKVDSPGGEVLASDEISNAIRDFQKKKPIVASMGSLAASGGYYVSAPCRWIVANELTITGSIGVIMNSWNYRGLMDKVGVMPQTFKSGKYKDMLSGSREPESITPEEKAMVQSLIDETYGKFKSVVQDGRSAAHNKNQNQGRSLTANWTDYADGRVLSGTEAYKLGFVDELGSFEKAVARAKTLTGISDANVVEYQQRYDLSDFLRIFGKSEAGKAVKVDWGLDTPKLKAGQLYFLSPTFFH